MIQFLADFVPEFFLQIPTKPLDRGGDSPFVCSTTNQFIEQKDRSTTYIDMHEYNVEK